MAKTFDMQYKTKTNVLFEKNLDMNKEMNTAKRKSVSYPGQNTEQASCET